MTNLGKYMCITFQKVYKTETGLTCHISQKHSSSSSSLSSENQSINQSMYFKERFKLHNLQIYINIFYFYMKYL